MTLFEQHMRRYHPDSTTARLSREVEELRSSTNRVSTWWTAATESEFDYACAEEFFATRCAPKAICVEGRQLVVTEWLFNPSLNADEDDLPRED